MIEVRDAAGNVIFDGSTRLVKFIGTMSIGSGSPQSGSLYVPQFAANPRNTPFFARSDGGWDYKGWDAVISISNNTIYWNYPTASGRPAQTIIYGIF